MSPDHAVAGTRRRSRLAWVFVLVVAFMAVEVVGGLLTGSLALLSDAGHMATDALGVGMALAAVTVAGAVRVGGHRTFGLYRLEILAALANAVLLVGVAAYVLVEAVSRFRQPTDILTGPMLAVAVVGLAVNVVGWLLLHTDASESLGMQAALFEVTADLVGSLAVIAAALIVRLTGWPYADPLFGAGLGFFILPRAVRLGSTAARILLEAAPDGIDVNRIRHDLSAIRGVSDVHDLHVWSLTVDMPMASAHLRTDAGTDPHPVLDEARRLLDEEYGIAHATLQIEPASHESCTSVSW